MLDTDTCIYTLKNKPQAARQRFQEYRDYLCISSVTAMELVYGAEKSTHPERSLSAVEGFFARLDILDFDMHAAQHAAQIRAALQKAGTPIGPYDQMIAGHARSRGLVVVTNNESEFNRVRGLQVENWAIG